MGQESKLEDQLIALKHSNQSGSYKYTHIMSSAKMLNSLLEPCFLKKKLKKNFNKMF
jgi:hypothetical protein